MRKYPLIGERVVIKSTGEIKTVKWFAKRLVLFWDNTFVSLGKIELFRPKQNSTKQEEVIYI